MENKKAFTLIELLAVLVVLAILALISIPITIRIINNARENSYKRSIANYGRAVESYLGKYLTEHDVDYKTIKLSDIEDQIEYSGNNVTCKQLKFKDNGDIVLRGCSVDNSKKYKYEDRKVVEDAYEIGDLISVNGISFYVINVVKDADYLVAIKAKPLTVGEIETYGEGHINKMTCANQGVVYNYNDNNTGGMAYYSSATCNCNDYSGCTADYALSDVKVVVNNWSDGVFINNELKEVDGYKGRLINISELGNLGYGRIIGVGRVNSQVPSWVYTLDYWYWASDRYGANYYVYYVAPDGDAFYNRVYNDWGAIRPVINVYKDKID